MAETVDDQEIEFMELNMGRLAMAFREALREGGSPAARVLRTAAENRPAGSQDRTPAEYQAALTLILELSDDPLPLKAQVEYGCDETGRPRSLDGQYTRAGQEYVDALLATFSGYYLGVKQTLAAREHARQNGEGGAAALAAAVAGAAGLKGPVRAAMRAFAQTLTAALDDGASDDAGLDDSEPRCEDCSGCTERIVGRTVAGHRLARITLGVEPYVLVRLNTIPGFRKSAVTVRAGGGVGPRDGDAIGVVELLEHALDAARHNADNTGVTVKTDVETETEWLYRLFTGEKKTTDTPQRNTPGGAPVSDDGYASGDGRHNAEPEGVDPDRGGQSHDTGGSSTG